MLLGVLIVFAARGLLLFCSIRDLVIAAFRKQDISAFALGVNQSHGEFGAAIIADQIVPIVALG